MIRQVLKDLGPIVSLSRDLVDDRSAIVEISDPLLFIDRIERAETQIGFRVECSAYAGGRCLLRVTGDAR